MSAGQPPILDDVKRGEICALLTAGLKFTEAARYVGCTPRTIRREVSRNAPFRREVHDALLTARLAPDKLLRQAAGRNWRAAAWLLERTDPQFQPRRNQVACTPDDLDAACRWIIDVAMHEIDWQKRTRLYRRLTAIARDVRSQVLLRTDPRKPVRTPVTLFYDMERRAEEFKMSSLADAKDFDDELAEADSIPTNSVRTAPAEESQIVGSQHAPGGQNSPILSAQTCASRADRLAPSVTESQPLRQAS